MRTYGDATPGISPTTKTALTRKTAFVTGATGFLGLNLVDCLCQGGWDVVALHRASSDLRYLKRFPARFAEGTIEDADIA